MTQQYPKTDRCRLLFYPKLSRTGLAFSAIVWLSFVLPNGRPSVFCPDENSLVSLFLLFSNYFLPIRSDSPTSHDSCNSWAGTRLCVHLIRVHREGSQREKSIFKIKVFYPEPTAKDNQTEMRRLFYDLSSCVCLVLTGQTSVPRVILH